MRISDILLQPHMTEKSMANAAYRRYTFLVNPKATSNDVKLAIKEIYNVTPLHVHLINTYGGKRRNLRDRRQFTFMRKTKKAVVELKEGDAIDIYDTNDHA